MRKPRILQIVKRHAIISYAGFLLLLSLPLHAQKYLWPTNASKHLSSSFCEYRPGHYHSAIDIKTWNREGYPIYAVEKGRIVRIRVSPFGYGKVLYLLLSDGRTAVYAHLQKFNKKLEQAVQRMQIKQERYSIQWYPRNWPVKKGEVLGYTGQTGIGVPHLHFEIRDEKGRPLQPLTFYPEYQDDVKPTLQSLLVIPQNTASSVNNSYRPQAFSMHKKKNGKYILKQTIRARGTFGLAIRGFDRSNDVSNKLAFYRLKLFINDSLHFAMRYDTLDFALTNQVDVDIHYPTRRTSGKRYNKLYIDSFNTLPFYGESPGNGLIRITDKPFHFRIEVSDYRGNTSIVLGKIETDDSAFIPALKLINISDSSAYLQLRLPKDIKEMRFSTQNDSGIWQPVRFFDLLGRSSEESGENMLIKVRLNSPVDRVLRLDTDNAQKETFYAVLSENYRPKINMKLSYQEKYILARFQPFMGESLRNVRIFSGRLDTLLTPLVHNGIAEVALCPRWFESDTLRIQLLNNAHAYFDTTLSFFLFKPGVKVEKRLAPFISMKTQPTTLFDTVLVHLQENPFYSDLQVPFFSPIFNLSFAGPVLNKSALVEVRYDSLTVMPGQVGLYFINQNGKMHFAGGKTDTSEGVLKARIHSMGAYVVAADTIPPDLEIIYPKNRAVLKRLKPIRFHADDELSGISSDANIHINIDNRFVIPEWDPETGVVKGRPHWILERGEHTLHILVNDAAGNRTEKRLKFYIEK